MRNLWLLVLKRAKLLRSEGFETCKILNPIQMNIKEAGLHINTQDGDGLKTALELPGIGGYSTNLPTGVLSY